MQRLEGMAALVTGGGRGIGRAVALAFARAGARVAVAARTRSEIESVATECGGGAIAIPLDVSDEHACESAVKKARAELGRLDILVNNAGIASSHKFTELETATWRRILAVDLDGPFFLTRAALPVMLEQGEGAVISIASIAARVGMPYVAAYTAAKHGLLGLMRSLAADNVRKGVTFNCVCPAYVDTPMTEESVTRLVELTGRPREEAQRLLFTPQGRLVTPEEVAEVCVLLASRAGRGITGQAINVDGGYYQG